MLTRLEQVNKLYDILVLAHLEDFNFSPLLKDLNWLHICFVDGLDSNLARVSLMLGKLDNTELTLAQVLLQIVVVVDVELTNNLAD